MSEPMLVTLLGTLNDVKEEHHWKAPLPMVSNVPGSVMTVSLLQLLNALSPIDVTFVLLRSIVVKLGTGSFSGSESKLPQFSKALFPMLVNPVATLKSIELK